MLHHVQCLHGGLAVQGSIADGHAIIRSSSSHAIARKPYCLLQTLIMVT